MAERDIVTRLRLRGEEFSRELRSQFDRVPDEADRAGREAGERFGRSFGFSFTDVGLGNTISSGLQVVFGAISKSLDYARDLDNVSKSVGVNVGRLQELRYAASQVGVEANQLDDTLGDLTRRIGEASSGSRDAQKAFVDLGVGFKTFDGQGRSTEAVFTDIIQKLSEVENPAERARLGSALLGDEFAKLEPLARGGAAGLAEATSELRQMQSVLSEDEIRNLQVTNAKLEQMKTVLSVKIAGVVAENSDAILRLAASLAEVADKSIKAADGYLQFNSAVNERSRRHFEINSNPKLSPAQRTAAKAEVDRELGFEDRPVGGILGALGMRESRYVGPRKPVDFLGVGRAWDMANEARRAVVGAAPAPTVDPKIARPKRTRTGKTEGKSEEEREAERAWREEERLREAIEKTIKAQEDSAQVERVRADQGEVAAAQEEARLRFEREHPEVLAKTTDELARMLGISGKLTDEQRQQLQNDLERLRTARQGAVDKAGKSEADRQHEEAVKAEKEVEEKLQRQREDNVRELAGLYQDLFTGGVDRVWKDFKSIGLRVISEVAAQWTLAQISGQSFNAGQAIQGGFSRSPLGAMFNGGRTLFGGAANDNEPSAAFKAAFKDFGIMPGDQKLPSAGGMGGKGGLGSMFPGLGDVAAGVGASVAIGSISDGLMDSIGIKSSGMGAMGGAALGMTVAGPIGAVVGSIIGGIAGGLLKKTKKGISTIGGSDDTLSILSTRGNSSSRKETSIGMAGSVLDSIDQIAEALGAQVDASRGSVSIGVRAKAFRVDPTGGGNTKVSKGAINFGTDEEAAVTAAVRDLIADGVLTGLSEASKVILAKGDDFEKAVEKAALIESVPRLLKQRLDPLGFALDQIDEKFRKLADALQEGGASAEQVAQARQLWQLEREDAVKQIGAASATLKDFLSSLAVGSNSPLSLRQQEAAARATLSPYEQQIETAKTARAEVDRLRSSGADEAAIKAAEDAARVAAGKIDQDGFQQAAQALLDIERAMNGSSGNFFASFDRIKQQTGLAISLIEAGATQTSASGSDPFSAAIAASTADAANILTDQSQQLAQVIAQLQAVNDNLGELRGSTWWQNDRAYV